MGVVFWVGESAALCLVLTLMIGLIRAELHCQRRSVPDPRRAFRPLWHRPFQGTPRERRSSSRHGVPSDTAAPLPACQWAPFVLLPDTDLRDLKRQYRRLAASHHPDHGGDPGVMAHINQLYGQLLKRYSSIA